MITLPLYNTEIFPNDFICINHYYRQFRFPKRKSNRLRNKFKNNSRNFKMIEVHRGFKIDGKLYVSNKIFKQIEKLYVNTEE